MAVVLDYPTADVPDTFEGLKQLYDWHVSHRDAPADLSDDDRRRYNLGLLRMNYPSWQRALARAEEVIYEPRTDLRFLTVEGPSQIGKTCLAKAIATMVCTREWADGDEYTCDGVVFKRLPVLAITAAANEAELMRALLGAFSAAARGSAYDMLTVLRERCLRHEVRVIIINDVHNASARSTSLINFYRRFLSRVDVPVVFTAVDFENSPLRSPRPGVKNEINDNLKQLQPPRRVPADLWPDTPRARVEDFSAALKAQAAALRLHRQEHSDLLTAETAQALLQRFDGRIGAALAAVAAAGHAAVGRSEKVGAAELGLKTNQRRGHRHVA